MLKTYQELNEILQNKIQEYSEQNQKFIMQLSQQFQEEHKENNKVNVSVSPIQPSKQKQNYNANKDDPIQENQKELYKNDFIKIQKYYQEEISKFTEEITSLKNQLFIHQKNANQLNIYKHYCTAKQNSKYIIEYTFS